MTKLLTIDDEIEFTSLIKGYFSLRGFEVYVANKGDEGLRLFIKERPQVCLIDLKMPGMHGDDVLREIMLIDPSTKCIMITASEGQGKTRKMLKEQGAFSCFDKPITSLVNLEQEIREALSA